MSSAAPNPYTSPSPEAKPSGGASIQVWRCFEYVFTSPNWLMNALLVAVCHMVPIVGPMVALGYVLEVMEALLKNPAARYGDFDMNRLQNYLMRGLWPFLVAFVASFVLMPVMLILIGLLYFAPMMLSGAIFGERAMGGVMLVLIPVSSLVLFAVLVLIQSVLITMQLAAGLTQDFSAGLNFTFVRDFLGRVGRELCLSLCVFMLITFALTFAGVLACGIGMLFAAAVCVQAMAHFYYQIYMLYLLRGGQPLPLKPELPGPGGV